MGGTVLIYVQKGHSGARGEPGSPEGSSDHGQCDGAEAAQRPRPPALQAPGLCAAHVALWPCRDKLSL